MREAVDVPVVEWNISHDLKDNVVQATILREDRASSPHGRITFLMNEGTLCLLNAYRTQLQAGDPNTLPPVLIPSKVSGII